MAFEDAVKTIIKDAFGKDTEVLKIQNEKPLGPGENYGSDLAFMTVTLKDENQAEKNLFIAAKTLPPSAEARKYFNVNICFPKEALFYQNVVPEYIKLEKECGDTDAECARLFPKFIGAKFGPNGEVTDDTTLVLENLKPQGFRMVPRCDGLDLAHSELVMKEIALFHALGIALRKKKPEVYDKVIQKEAGRSFKEGQNKEDILKTELEPFAGPVFKFLETLPECAHLVPRLKRAIDKHFLYEDMMDSYVPREPFCTFTHNDLWVNNIMFNYDESGAPKSLKLLDFQRTKVGSPLCDLLLFLYTSTTLQVMKDNFVELLKLYHDNLLTSLERLGVVSDELNWENFRKEISDHAPDEVFMAVCFLGVVMSDEREGGLYNIEKTEAPPNENFRTRNIEVVRDLARRGWI